MATTYDRLKKIVVEQLGADEDEVKPEASFVDDLNADSLDLVELIMSLEEEFGTEISDEDAEKIRTVQDAVDYIDEHRPRRSRPARRATGEAVAAATRAPGPGPRPAGAGARPLQLAPRASGAAHRPQRTPRVPGRRGGQPRDLRGALRPSPRRRRGRAAPGARRSSRQRVWPARRPHRPGCRYLQLGEGEGAAQRPAPAVPAGVHLRGRRRRPLPRSRLRPVRDWLVGWPARSCAEGPRREPQEPKSRFQEYTQRRSGERPAYRLVDATGPDHEKSFRIEVWVDGEVLGVGEGPSRRVAETAAAPR